ncbi:Tubby- protein 3 [Chytridiales sp. JEL 0842]|nr:Tubby- protein 3 [Chytridiales sp. JEL 0842]
MPADIEGDEQSSYHDIQAELKSLKRELKDWEHAFQAENSGRKPDKTDIAANKAIARKYKAYAKLKSTADAAPAPTTTQAPSSKTDNKDRARKDKKKPTNQDEPKKKSSSKKQPPSDQLPPPLTFSNHARTMSARAAEDNEGATFFASEQTLNTSIDSQINSQEPLSSNYGFQQNSASQVHIASPPTPNGRASRSQKPSSPGLNDEDDFDSYDKQRWSRDGSLQREGPPRSPGGGERGFREEEYDEFVEAERFLRERMGYGGYEEPEEREERQREQRRESTSAQRYSEVDNTTRNLDDGYYTQRVSSGGRDSFNESTFIRGDILSPSTPPPRTFQNANPSSPPQQQSPSQNQQPRPWGPSAGLPQNFKIRRSTIPMAPLPTHSLSIPTPSLAPTSNVVQKEEFGLKTFTDKGALGGVVGDNGDYMDFIQRRNRLAGGGLTPNGSSTSGNAAPDAIVPVSSLTPKVEAGGQSRNPVVQQTHVVGESAAAAPPAVVEKKPDAAAATAAVDFSKYAKPFDPNDSDSDDSDASPAPIVSLDKKTQSASSVLSGPNATTEEKLEGLKSPRAKEGEDDEKGQEGAAVVPAAAGAVVAGAGGVEVKSLSGLVKMFARVPQDSILRCKLYRKKNLLDKAYPSFFLYNESSSTFLLAARKRKKSKTVSYLLSTSQDDLSKDSTHYVAKLKANFQRTQFVLYDARFYNKGAKAKGLKELSCMTYSKTVLPREMNVAVPATHLDENSEDTTLDILTDIRMQNTQKLLFLRNKPPRWNESTQSHCLNFGGRVTQPSIKNFQLIMDNNENYIVMQFGRCGPDYFTLDVRWPMTPLEAFAVALTTFDAYDSA